VRNIVPKKQVKEVVQRFELENYFFPFTRCLECNSLLSKIEKEKIVDRLPAKVKYYHEEFFICSHCDKIFWKGTHFVEMERLIDFIKKS
jgi:uncharacterized protein with PIN domain